MSFSGGGNPNYRFRPKEPVVGFNKMRDAIVELVKLGEVELASDKVKVIKVYCQGGKEREIGEEVMRRYQRKHSQVRIVLLEIIAYLMERSKQFRTYLSNQLTNLVKLSLHPPPNTLNTHTTFPPLPLPQPYTDLLHQRMTELLASWYHEFGTKYPQIQTGYFFVKDVYKVDFSLVTLPDRVKTKLNDRTTSKRSLLKPTKKTSTQLPDPTPEELPTFNQEEYQTFLAELTNLLSRSETELEKLIPDLLGLSLKEDSLLTRTTQSNVYETIQKSGLGSNRYQLNISIADNDDESPDYPTMNSATDSTRSELFQIYQRLTNHYQLEVSDWLTQLIKSKQLATQFHTILECRSRLEDTLARIELLQFHLPVSTSLNEVDLGTEEEEDEFSEVPDSSAPPPAPVPPPDPDLDSGSPLLPWEKIERQICQRNNLPFLREPPPPSSSRRRPSRNPSNLIRLTRPLTTRQRVDRQIIKENWRH